MPQLFGVAIDMSTKCEEIADYQCFFPTAFPAFGGRPKLKIFYYCQSHTEPFKELPHILIEEL